MKKIIASLISISFLYTTLSAPFVEAGFWEERSRAVQQKLEIQNSKWGKTKDSHINKQFAQLPANIANINQIIPTQTTSLSHINTLPEQVANLSESSPLHKDLKHLPQWLTSLPLEYGEIRQVHLAQDLPMTNNKLPVTSHPLIIHIQDVHGYADAQMNISKIIQTIGQRAGAFKGKPSPSMGEEKGEGDKKRLGLLIGVEGASGRFDLERFQNFPDKKIMKDVADFMLDQHIIPGTEHAAWTAEKTKLETRNSKLSASNFNQYPAPIELWGVEDRDLYLANVKSYADARPLKDAMSTQLQQWQKTLDNLKKQIYSPELQKFDALYTQYSQGDLGLGSYLKEIGSYPSRNSLRDAFDEEFREQSERISCPEGANFVPEGDQFQFNISSFPNLKLFLEAVHAEESLDFKRVESERAQLIKRLTTTLSQQQISGLIEKSLLYKMGKMSYGRYYKELIQLCKKIGINLDNGKGQSLPTLSDKQVPCLAAKQNRDHALAAWRAKSKGEKIKTYKATAKNFSELAKYIEYVLKSEKIQKEKIFNELKEFEKTVAGSLLKTQDQKTLHTLAQDHLLIQKLTGFVMTPEDWSVYKKNMDRIHDLPERISLLYEVKRNWPPSGTKLAPYGHEIGSLRSRNSLPEASPFPESLIPFENFCRLAIRRNEGLLDNLLKKLANFEPEGRQFQSKQPSLAVLVAGGFHTEGLTRLMRERNVSYVVITPKIKKINKDAHSLDFLLDKTPLEKLFHTEKITLSKSLAFASQPLRPNPEAEAWAEVSTFIRACIKAGGKGMEKDIEDAAQFLDPKAETYIKTSVNGKNQFIIQVTVKSEMLNKKFVVEETTTLSPAYERQADAIQWTLNNNKNYMIRPAQPTFASRLMDFATASAILICTVSAGVYRTAIHPLPALKTTVAGFDDALRIVFIGVLFVVILASIGYIFLYLYSGFKAGQKASSLRKPKKTFDGERKSDDAQGITKSQGDYEGLLDFMWLADFEKSKKLKEEVSADSEVIKDVLHSSPDERPAEEESESDSEPEKSKQNLDALDLYRYAREFVSNRKSEAQAEDELSPRDFRLIQWLRNQADKESAGKSIVKAFIKIGTPLVSFGQKKGTSIIGMTYEQVVELIEKDRKSDETPKEPVASSLPAQADNMQVVERVPSDERAAETAAEPVVADGTKESLPLHKPEIPATAEVAPVPKDDLQDAQPQPKTHSKPEPQPEPEPLQPIFNIPVEYYFNTDLHSSLIAELGEPLRNNKGSVGINSGHYDDMSGFLDTVQVNMNHNERSQKSLHIVVLDGNSFNKISAQEKKKFLKFARGKAVIVFYRPYSISKKSDFPAGSNIFHADSPGKIMQIAADCLAREPLKIMLVNRPKDQAFKKLKYRRRTDVDVISVYPKDFTSGRRIEEWQDKDLIVVNVRKMPGDKMKLVDFINSTDSGLQVVLLVRSNYEFWENQIFRPNVSIARSIDVVSQKEEQLLLEKQNTEESKSGLSSEVFLRAPPHSAKIEYVYEMGRTPDVLIVERDHDISSLIKLRRTIKDRTNFLFVKAGQNSDAVEELPERLNKGNFGAVVIDVSLMNADELWQIISYIKNIAVVLVGHKSVNDFATAYLTSEEAKKQFQRTNVMYLQKDNAREIGRIKLIIESIFEHVQKQERLGREPNPLSVVSGFAHLKHYAAWNQLKTSAKLGAILSAGLMVFGVWWGGLPMPDAGAWDLVLYLANTGGSALVLGFLGSVAYHEAGHIAGFLLVYPFWQTAYWLSRGRINKPEFLSMGRDAYGVYIETPDIGALNKITEWGGLVVSLGFIYQALAVLLGFPFFSFLSSIPFLSFLTSLNVLPFLSSLNPFIQLCLGSFSVFMVKQHVSQKINTDRIRNYMLGDGEKSFHVKQAVQSLGAPYPKDEHSPDVPAINHETFDKMIDIFRENRNNNEFKVCLTSFLCQAIGFSSAFKYTVSDDMLQIRYKIRLRERHRLTNSFYIPNVIRLYKEDGHVKAVYVCLNDRKARQLRKICTRKQGVFEEMAGFFTAYDKYNGATEHWARFVNERAAAAMLSHDRKFQVSQSYVESSVVDGAFTVQEIGEVLAHMKGILDKRSRKRNIDRVLRLGDHFGHVEAIHYVNNYLLIFLDTAQVIRLLPFGRRVIVSYAGSDFKWLSVLKRAFEDKNYRIMRSLIEIYGFEASALKESEARTQSRLLSVFSYPYVKGLSARGLKRVFKYLGYADEEEIKKIIAGCLSSNIYEDDYRFNASDIDINYDGQQLAVALKNGERIVLRQSQIDEDRVVAVFVCHGRYSLNRVRSLFDRVMKPGSLIDIVMRMTDESDVDFQTDPPASSEPKRNYLTWMQVHAASITSIGPVVGMAVALTLMNDPSASLNAWDFLCFVAGSLSGIIYAIISHEGGHNAHFLIWALWTKLKTHKWPDFSKHKWLGYDKKGLYVQTPDLDLSGNRFVTWGGLGVSVLLAVSGLILPFLDLNSFLSSWINPGFVQTFLMMSATFSLASIVYSNEEEGDRYNLKHGVKPIGGVVKHRIIKKKNKKQKKKHRGVKDRQDTDADLSAGGIMDLMMGSHEETLEARRVLLKRIYQGQTKSLYASIEKICQGNKKQQEAWNDMKDSLAQDEKKINDIIQKLVVLIGTRFSGYEGILKKTEKELAVSWDPDIYLRIIIGSIQAYYKTSGREVPSLLNVFFNEMLVVVTVLKMLDQNNLEEKDWVEIHQNYWAIDSHRLENVLTAVLDGWSGEKKERMERFLKEIKMVGIIVDLVVNEEEGNEAKKALIRTLMHDEFALPKVGTALHFRREMQESLSDHINLFIDYIDLLARVTNELTDSKCLFKAQLDEKALDQAEILFDQIGLDIYLIFLMAYIDHHPNEKQKYHLQIEAFFDRIRARQGPQAQAPAAQKQPGVQEWQILLKEAQERAKRIRDIKTAWRQREQEEADNKEQGNAKAWQIREAEKSAEEEKRLQEIETILSEIQMRQEKEAAKRAAQEKRWEELAEKDRQAAEKADQEIKDRLAAEQAAQERLEEQEWQILLIEAQERAERIRDIKTAWRQREQEAADDKEQGKAKAWQIREAERSAEEEKRLQEIEMILSEIQMLQEKEAAKRAAQEKRWEKLEEEARQAAAKAEQEVKKRLAKEQAAQERLEEQEWQAFLESVKKLQEINEVWSERRKKEAAEKEQEERELLQKLAEEDRAEEEKRLQEIERGWSEIKARQEKEAGERALLKEKLEDGLLLGLSEWEETAEEARQAVEKADQEAKKRLAKEQAAQERLEEQEWQILLIEAQERAERIRDIKTAWRQREQEAADDKEQGNAEAWQIREAEKSAEEEKRWQQIEEGLSEIDAYKAKEAAKRAEQKEGALLKPAEWEETAEEIRLAEKRAEQKAKKRLPAEQAAFDKEIPLFIVSYLMFDEVMDEALAEAERLLMESDHPFEVLEEVGRALEQVFVEYPEYMDQVYEFFIDIQNQFNFLGRSDRYADISRRILIPQSQDMMAFYYWNEFVDFANHILADFQYKLRTHHAAETWPVQEADTGVSAPEKSEDEKSVWTKRRKPFIGKIEGFSYFKAKDLDDVLTHYSENQDPDYLKGAIGAVFSPEKGFPAVHKVVVYMDGLRVVFKGEKTAGGRERRESIGIGYSSKHAREVRGKFVFYNSAQLAQVLDMCETGLLRYLVPSESIQKSIHLKLAPVQTVKKASGNQNTRVLISQDVLGLSSHDLKALHDYFSGPETAGYLTMCLMSVLPEFGFLPLVDIKTGENMFQMIIDDDNGTVIHYVVDQSKGNKVNGYYAGAQAQEIKEKCEGEKGLLVCAVPLLAELADSGLRVAQTISAFDVLERAFSYTDVRNGSPEDIVSVVNGYKQILVYHEINEMEKAAVRNFHCHDAHQKTVVLKKFAQENLSRMIEYFQYLKTPESRLSSVRRIFPKATSVSLDASAQTVMIRIKGNTWIYLKTSSVLPGRVLVSVFSEESSQVEALLSECREKRRLCLLAEVCRHEHFVREKSLTVRTNRATWANSITRFSAFNVEEFQEILRYFKHLRSEANINQFIRQRFPDDERFNEMHITVKENEFILTLPDGLSILVSPLDQDVFPGQMICSVAAQDPDQLNDISRLCRDESLLHECAERAGKNLRKARQHNVQRGSHENAGRVNVLWLDHSIIPADILPADNGRINESVLRVVSPRNRQERENVIVTAENFDVAVIAVGNGTGLRNEQLMQVISRLKKRNQGLSIVIKAIKPARVQAQLRIHGWADDQNIQVVQTLNPDFLCKKITQITESKLASQRLNTLYGNKGWLRYWVTLSGAKHFYEYFWPLVFFVIGVLKWRDIEKIEVGFERGFMGRRRLPSMSPVVGFSLALLVPLTSFAIAAGFVLLNIWGYSFDSIWLRLGFVIFSVAFAFPHLVLSLNLWPRKTPDGLKSRGYILGEYIKRLFEPGRAPSFGNVPKKPGNVVRVLLLDTMEDPHEPDGKNITFETLEAYRAAIIEDGGELHYEAVNGIQEIGSIGERAADFDIVISNADNIESTRRLRRLYDMEDVCVLFVDHGCAESHREKLKEFRGYKETMNRFDVLILLQMNNLIYISKDNQEEGPKGIQEMLGGAIRNILQEKQHPAVKPKRILIADDNPVLQEGIKNRLQEEGFECETADTVEKALESMELAEQAKVPFDLIVSDFDFKQTLNGIDFIRSVRGWETDAYQNTPVILDTDSPLSKIGGELRRLGVIQDPGDNEEILSALSALSIAYMRLARLNLDLTKTVNELTGFMDHFEDGDAEVAKAILSARIERIQWEEYFFSFDDPKLELLAEVSAHLRKNFVRYELQKGYVKDFYHQVMASPQAHRNPKLRDMAEQAFLVLDLIEHKVYGAEAMSVTTDVRRRYFYADDPFGRPFKTYFDATTFPESLTVREHSHYSVIRRMGKQAEGVKNIKPDFDAFANTDNVRDIKQLPDAANKMVSEQMARLNIVNIDNMTNMVRTVWFDDNTMIFVGDNQDVEVYEPIGRNEESIEQMFLQKQAYEEFYNDALGRLGAGEEKVKLECLGYYGDNSILMFFSNNDVIYFGAIDEDSYGVSIKHMAALKPAHSDEDKINQLIEVLNEKAQGKKPEQDLLSKPQIKVMGGLAFLGSLALIAGGLASWEQLLPWWGLMLVVALVHELGHSLAKFFVTGIWTWPEWSDEGLGPDTTGLGKHSRIFVKLAGPAAGALLILFIVCLTGFSAEASWYVKGLFMAVSSFTIIPTDLKSDVVSAFRQPKTMEELLVPIRRGLGDARNPIPGILEKTGFDIQSGSPAFVGEDILSVAVLWGQWQAHDPARAKKMRASLHDYLRQVHAQVYKENGLSFSSFMRVFNDQMAESRRANIKGANLIVSDLSDSTGQQIIGQFNAMERELNLNEQTQGVVFYPSSSLPVLPALSPALLAAQDVGRLTLVPVFPETEKETIAEAVANYPDLPMRIMTKRESFFITLLLSLGLDLQIIQFFQWFNDLPIRIENLDNFQNKAAYLSQFA